MKKTTASALEASATNTMNKVISITQATEFSLQSEIDQLEPKSKAVLQFIANVLRGFRKAEPLYSTITDTDVSKTFGFDKKTTASVVNSLLTSLFLFRDEADKNVLFINWQYIPTTFGATEPDYSQFKNNNKPEAEKKASESKSEEKAFLPYQKHGLHGTNSELDGFKTGDPITFELKNKKVQGEYRHLHINKHSPNGYVVIKYAGGIYERTPNKVWPIEKKKTATRKQAAAL